MSHQNVEATLYYLKRSELYKTTKPYSLAFAAKKIPRSNLKTDKREDVSIRDIRGLENTFNFQRNGFAVIEMQTSMGYHDFDDPKKVDEIFCREVAHCLLEYMNASTVHVFDTRVSHRF
jgi:hypothetical protein